MVINRDIIVIGGGPAGSLSAIKLKKSGFNVTLLEKEKFPRFVIGESLLPNCNAILEENGLLEAISNQKFQLKKGAVFINENFDRVSYNFSDNLGYKWGTSFQVKREEFDNVLLDEAKKFGVEVIEEIEVTEFNEKDLIIKAVKNSDEFIYKTKFVIDSSGYGRVLPKLLNLDKPSSLKLRRAVFRRVEDKLRPIDDTKGDIYIYIHGNNEAWIWVIPFSDGSTSLGIVCEEEYFKSFNLSEEEFWKKIIYSDKNSKERFFDSKTLNSVGTIYGYSSSVSKMYGENYILCGNSSEFLDPVFSSGVTLALESANRASNLVIKKLNGEVVNFEEEYSLYMKRGIEVFREFVNAWYDGRLQKLFFIKEQFPKIRQSISSVLGGYVWDEKNMFVRSPKASIDSIIRISN